MLEISDLIKYNSIKFLTMTFKVIYITVNIVTIIRYYTCPDFATNI